MTLAETVHQLLHDSNVLWKLDSGAHIEPNVDDVQRVLDRAVATLYDGNNDQIEVAGLLIRRTGKDYAVYVAAGKIKGE